MDPRNKQQQLYPDDDEEAEPDLDLDLNELDPYSAGAPRAASGGRRAGRHIPLRHLRRRAQEEGEDEDVKALVGGDEHVQSRRTSEVSEEESGLLGSRHQHVPFPGLQGDYRTRRRKGFWHFFTRRRGKGMAISLPASSSNLTDDPTTHRDIPVGIVFTPKNAPRYPQNSISNTKYTPWNFLPLTLYHEFKFFFNLYFLLVALSQVVPVLRIGYLSTYVAPLAFVMTITLGKEAWDDIGRRRRDRAANGERVRVLDLATPAETGKLGQGMKKSIQGRRRGKRKSRGEDEHNGEGLLEEFRVREVLKPSRDLKVGDVVVLSKDQRVPADVVILKSLSTDGASKDISDDVEAEDDGSDTTLVDTHENVAAAPSRKSKQEDPSSTPLANLTTTEDTSGGGEAFIRTDQLDGETDWKLRLASPLVQTLPTAEYTRLRLAAGPPSRNVNAFTGTLELQNSDSNDHGSAKSSSAPLTIDNTAWANTVLASSTTVHAVVIYTGTETRAAMSTSSSRTKTGLLEHEINSLTKILCILTAALSLTLVVLERTHQPRSPGFGGVNEEEAKHWAVTFTRFLILFSTIVPISLRVNLDMAKSVYAYFIHHDNKLDGTGIPGTVVRTSTIPEDLGRIEYLLTDKTGTLTRNEMVLRKIFVGGKGFGGRESWADVQSIIRECFGEDMGPTTTPRWGSRTVSGTRNSRETGSKVKDLVLALALCHNVTPTIEDDDGAEGGSKTSYQASSPDEIAIVQWTEAVGLRLARRDRKSMSLEIVGDDHQGGLVMKVEILQVFPFTSESKRMGVILRFIRQPAPKGLEQPAEEIVFYQKGADTVMTTLVRPSDWLTEETDNMAREGLRTLVISRKRLSRQQYDAFTTAYNTAAVTLSSDRDAAMAKVARGHLEHDQELLGITGVEDKLQEGVKSSLELLRNAGIKIWMLTGDKIETARCIALSSKLVPRNQHIHTIASLTNPDAALDALVPLQNNPSNTALLLDGTSLATLLTHHPDLFIQTAVRLPAVIACRCSPTQKADVAHLIRAATKKRIACIGDGGNDVSMITAADVGLGLEGKEGQQASLAADFSLTQFSHVPKLLLWHGRNSYKRSAKLAQFVMYRGLIISLAQTVFSLSEGGFEPVALFRDWLVVGYATIYTMMPVFSLVLDRDVDEGLARLYPELYAELRHGRALSLKSFGVWVAVSLWQGVVVQAGSQVLLPSFLTGSLPDDGGSLGLDTQSVPFRRLVSISYTSLVLTEIAMVAIEVVTWHPIMIFSCLGTALLYFASFPALGQYFDLDFVVSPGLGFWWRVAAVTAGSVGPVALGKVIGRRWRPSSYRKVRG
ncbi:hypothetical protein LTR62_007778 [Meristemomyces frigidus]|uniref:Phospholipid-transporting ATPase n=1 Tax=Meristemomyces frigidus TaxID=1508187 RepID=A0AAN7TIJ5_9PEZI|nr:hypothetical protein LTR62_007778 [Meristemomyces frigidus]